MLVYMVVHVFTSTNLFIHSIPYLAFSLSTKIAVVCMWAKQEAESLAPTLQQGAVSEQLSWMGPP